MTERSQQKGETLQQYFHSKAKLCGDLGLAINDTKEQILVGLWSRDLYNAMSSRLHGSLDALLHDMLDYECTSSQRMNRLKTNSFMYSSTPWGNNTTGNYKPSSDTLAKGTESQASLRPTVNDKGEMRCFNCNNYGHISKNCEPPKKEPYCVRCKQLGHFQRACPTNISEVKIIQDQPSTSVNKYLKPVYINQAVFRSFVDMGSAACLIKASIALLNQYPITYEQMDLKRFGPESYRVKSPGYVEVSIRVDEAEAHQVKCRIVPDDMLTTDVLIGRPFTDHENVDYFN